MNNTSLHLIQELEKRGKCSAIQVEIVPLTKVPESLQKGMIIDEEEKSNLKASYSLTETNDQMLKGLKIHLFILQITNLKIFNL